MPDTYIPLGHSIDGAWPCNEHQPVCTACVHACYPSNRGLTRTTPPWLLSSTGQQGAVMGHVASVRNHPVLSQVGSCVLTDVRCAFVRRRRARGSMTRIGILVVGMTQPDSPQLGPRWDTVSEMFEMQAFLWHVKRSLDGRSRICLDMSSKCIYLARSRLTKD